MLFLGVDSGTSVVKAVIFNETGDEVASGRREMPVLQPRSGYSEVDMQQVWSLTADAIQDAITQIDATQLKSVGFSGTACGFWGVDADMKPIRNAILWNDGRAGSIISEWQASGFYQTIFDRTGNAPFPGYPLSLLRWLAIHEPETLDQVAYLLFHKDWLRWNLTGDVHGDVSDMSYFPGSLDNRQYDETLLTEMGLSHLIPRLPALLESEAQAGTVSAQAAARTGIPAGTPVATGSVDVVASVLGGGAVQAGQACSILGTSFLNSLVATAPSYIPAMTGVQACMPDHLWVRSLVNTSGTINMDWMLQTLAHSERQASDDETLVFEQVEALVQTSPVGANGLIYLPYLNTAGIVSPFADPNARGLFFGLSMEHTRADLLRAVYEGTALAMRDCYTVSDQPVAEVTLVGGGARSAFWAQMFADATGKTILIPSGTEFGARGAAMLGAICVGAFDNTTQAAAQMVRIDRRYDPNPANTARYDAMYTLYRHLYENAREGWQLRARLLAEIEADTRTHD